MNKILLGIGQVILGLVIFTIASWAAHLPPWPDEGARWWMLPVVCAYVAQMAFCIIIIGDGLYVFLMSMSERREQN